MVHIFIGTESQFFHPSSVKHFKVLFEIILFSSRRCTVEVLIIVKK